MKKAVVLVNLGSPASLSLIDVWKFLTSFLNDARVIDLPLVFRKILVNLIIVPFRLSKSRNMYKKIWNEEGSIIIKHGHELSNKLSNLAGEKSDIYLAMRYGKPNIKEVLSDIYQKQYDDIVVVPLFPHYASSTVGSIVEKTMKIIKKWNNIPAIRFTAPFYNNRLFISAWANNASYYNISDYDHVLFSYHGLPLRHIAKSHFNKGSCDIHNCTAEINDFNKFCYKAQCYETTKLLAEKLKIPRNKYSICFQSRFSKNWLKPFADKSIIELANKGVKKIIVFPLSFVADCLETAYEIGDEYDKLFKKHGGAQLTLATSLNSNDFWVKSLKQIIYSQDIF